MGRVLGIDHGDKRIGLALSDPLRMIGSPLKTIHVKNTEELLNEIKAIINDNEVDLIVLGLPLGMKGQETEQTKHVKKFAQELNKFNIQVVFEDERLTSVTAKKSLVEENIKTGHNKGLVDQVAAAILLQQYLDKLV